jgi:arginine exporter protein ArgO
MKRDYTLLFIGIWIMILPFLGFPTSWKKVLLIVTGLFVVFIGYMVWRERLNKEKQENTQSIANEDVLNQVPNI